MPYIDVMLVLLIIFMVTAPLLNLGVDIQLPQSKAKSIQNDKEPVIVSVDQDGKLFPYAWARASANRSRRPPWSTKFQHSSARIRRCPCWSRGDQRADYGKIYQAMVLLQTAGVPKVGLMSQPVQASEAR